MKSRVSCTQCDNESLTFDPFNVLSLPIPTIKNMSFSIKYIPWSTGHRPMEFMLSVGEYVTVNEIRSKINEYLESLKKVTDEDDWVEPFLTQV